MTTQPSPTGSDPNLPKPATIHTRAMWETADVDLDPADFERARRGLIATHPTGQIDAGGGWVASDINRYAFLDGETPDTVHPSLWRHAQLDAIHGLFEVAHGVWQVRGYDISNITVIAGDTGWLVIDPLTTEHTARAAIELANAHLGERPVVGVIYTHSHADHFGGVLGVTTQADVDAGRCIVVAPEGFLHETVAENVIGGPAMGRRALYQFGPLLPPGPRGHVDCGLGIAIPITPSGLIAPTHDITATGQEMVIDGIRIVFQNTPNTEAPAEMNFFFPDRGWLCMAENCAHTMHNLVPIRGAQVRDALAWSKYIDEAIEMFAADTEVMFTSHHWPRWGAEDVRGFLSLQRDLYRWLHDQTMRLANHGYTAPEIAEMLTLPAEFAAHSHTRGYYGHLVHNIKAVYQRYLSWYDGNPARLNQHPPVEAGKRYVEIIGGADVLLERARASFEAGDYRWVVEVVNHLVFAEPTNLAARRLQADALEQLGYQTESSTYRNAYLMGAQELRHGFLPPSPARRRGLVQAMTTELVLDSVAVRLKAEEVAGQSATLNLTITDLDEQWVLGLAHSAIHAVGGRHQADAEATVILDREALLSLVIDGTPIAELIESGATVVDGSVEKVDLIFGNLDVFMNSFAIVEP